MKLIGYMVVALIFLLALGTYRTEALQEKPEIWPPNTKVYLYGAPGEAEESGQAETIIGETVRHKVQEGEGEGGASS